MAIMQLALFALHNDKLLRICGYLNSFTVNEGAIFIMVCNMYTMLSWQCLHMKEKGSLHKASSIQKFFFVKQSNIVGLYLLLSMRSHNECSQPTSWRANTPIGRSQIPLVLTLRILVINLHYGIVNYGL